MRNVQNLFLKGLKIPNNNGCIKRKPHLLGGLPMAGVVVVSCIDYTNSDEIDDFVICPPPLYSTGNCFCVQVYTVTK